MEIPRSGGNKPVDINTPVSKETGGGRLVPDTDKKILQRSHSEPVPDTRLSRRKTDLISLLPADHDLVSPPGTPFPNPGVEGEDRWAAFREGIQKAVASGVEGTDILEQLRAWYVIGTPQGDIYGKVHRGFNRTDLGKQVHSSTLALDEPLAVTFGKAEHSVQELIGRFDEKQGTFFPDNTWLGHRLRRNSASSDSGHSSASESSGALPNLDQQISMLSDDIGSSLADSEFTLDAGSQAKSQLDQTRTKLSESSRENAALAHESSELKRKARSVNTHSRAFSSRLSHVNQDVEQESRGKKAVDHVRKRISDLGLDLEKITQQCASLRSDCCELESRLGKQVDETERWRAEVDTAKAAAQQLEDKNAMYMGQERSYGERLRKLSADIHKLEKSQSLQEKDKKQVEMKLELATQGNAQQQQKILELSALNRKLQRDFEGVSLVLQQKQGRFEETKKALAVTSEQIASLKNTLGEQRGVIERYTYQLGDAATKTNLLEADLVAKTKENQELASQLQKQTYEAAISIGQLNGRIRDMAPYVDKVDELIASQASMKKVSDKLKVLLVDVGIRLSGANLEVVMQRDDIGKLKKSCHQLETKMESYKQELSLERDRRVALENELQGFEHQKEEMLQAIRSYGGSFSDATDTGIAVTQIIGQLATASSQVSTLEQKNTDLELKLKIADGMQKDVASKLETVQSEASETKTELLLVRRDLAISCKNAEEQTEKVKKLSKANEELTGSLGLAQKENERLGQTVKDAEERDNIQVTTFNSERQKIQGQLQSLQVDLQERDYQISEHKQQIQELTGKLQTASESEQTICEAIRVLKDENSQTKEQQKALEALRKADSRKIRSLETQVKTQIIELQETESERTSTAHKLRLKGQDILRQEEQIGKMKVEIRGLHEAVTTQQSQVKEGLAQIQTQEKKVVELQLEVGLAIQDKTKTEQEMKNLSLDVEGLRQGLEQSRDETVQALEKVSDIESQLKAKQQEASTLRESAVKAGQSFNKEKNEFSRRLQKAEQVSDDQKRDWEAAEKKWNTHDQSRDAKFEELEAQLKRAQEELSRTSDEAHQLKAQTEKLENKCAKLTDENEESQKRVDELFVATKDLRGTNERLEQQVVEVSSSLEDKERQIQLGKKENTHLKEEVETARFSKNQLEIMTADLEKRNAGAVAMLRWWKMMFLKQSHRVVKLENDVERLQGIDRRYSELADHVSGIQEKVLKLNASIGRISGGEKIEVQVSGTTLFDELADVELAQTLSLSGHSESSRDIRHKKLMGVKINPEGLAEKVRAHCEQRESEISALNENISSLQAELADISDCKQEASDSVAMPDEIVELKLDLTGTSQNPSEVESNRDQLLADLGKISEELNALKERFPQWDTLPSEGDETSAPRPENLPELSLITGVGELEPDRESSFVKKSEHIAVQKQLKEKDIAFDELMQAATDSQNYLDDQRIKAEEEMHKTKVLAKKMSDIFGRTMANMDGVISWLSDEQSGDGAAKKAFTNMINDMRFGALVEGNGWKDLLPQLERLDLQPDIRPDEVMANVTRIWSVFGQMFQPPMDEISKTDETEEGFYEESSRPSTTVTTPSLSRTNSSSSLVSDGSGDSGLGRGRDVDVTKTLEALKPILSLPISDLVVTAQ